MPYQLMLYETRYEEQKTKDTGENVFWDNLPADYAVYMFYYPGGMPNQELENRLRVFGDNTGKNLFVNIGRLNDKNYPQIAKRFNIKPLPVIILTAIGKLASSPSEFLSAYVRLDNKKLLGSPDLLMPSLEAIFNLFMQEKIPQAMGEVKRVERNLVISRLNTVAAAALKEIWAYVKDMNISFALGEYKLELKHKGE